MSSFWSYAPSKVQDSNPIGCKEFLVAIGLEIFFLNYQRCTCGKFLAECLCTLGINQDAILDTNANKKMLDPNPSYALRGIWDR